MSGDFAFIYKKIQKQSDKNLTENSNEAKTFLELN